MDLIQDSTITRTGLRSMDDGVDHRADEWNGDQGRAGGGWLAASNVLISRDPSSPSASWLRGDRARARHFTLNLRSGSSTTDPIHNSLS